MELLKDSLIKAAISEGAANPSNKGFSTKVIAQRCNVSEFSLFSIFKTKDALLDAAIDEVMEEFTSLCKKAARSSATLEDFTRKLIYHGFEKPEEMIFLANYGFWTGSDEANPERIRHDYEKSSAVAHEALTPLAPVDDDTWVLLWSFLTRHVVYDVEFVYDGIIPDTPANRAMSAALLAKGIRAFVKKEGA